MAKTTPSGRTSELLLIVFTSVALGASCSKDEDCSGLRQRARSSCHTPRLTLSRLQHAWKEFLAQPGPDREILDDLTATTVRTSLRCLEHARGRTPPPPAVDDADMSRYLGELGALIALDDAAEDLGCDAAREILRANCRDAIDTLERIEVAIRGGDGSAGLPPFASFSADIGRMCTGGDDSGELARLAVAVSEATLRFEATNLEGERRRIREQATRHVATMREIADAVQKRADGR